ncbi:MAG: hypothetical protein ACJ76Z_05295 [Thermoleophilaceae bacterium]
MSFKKVITYVAAAVAAFTLSAVAYADQGKSPNGPPGPAGNPNPPASQPQANGPQGPQGNGAQNQSAASHGKSAASHGKSDQSHGKSGAAKPNHSQHANHANPTPGTPRKGGREDRPAGKITICHATRSEKNPYVEITISVNGLHGHGPTDSDPVSRHHAGSWKDIIPAPAGGCPSTVSTEAGAQQQSAQQSAVQPPAPEVATQAVLGESAQGSNGVLGASAGGKSAPKSAVLGASASGRAPAAATAARSARRGALPFTGAQLAFVLIAAAVALLGGVALRRALAGQNRA